MNHKSIVARRLLLGGASLAALTLISFAAQAQTATPAPGDDAVDEVVVTGYRAGLASAIVAKRNETAAIDVIKAEDIADFPDANLAESLQRVPGVSINRVAGEGRAITVRGLSGSFSRVRVNGMEAQSTSGATTSDRGANGGRGFDFNTFASELFNSLTVRKTASAEVIEGSLGATVDLQTSRPFDQKGRTLVANAQAGFNTLSDNVDQKYSVVASDRWDTSFGEVGALVSLAYSQREYLEDQFGSGGWNPGTTDGGFCSPVGAAVQNPASGIQGSDAANCATGVPRPAANDTLYALGNRSVVFFPRLPRYGRFEHHQERLGGTASFQWRPSERTLINLDAVYSRFDVVRNESWLEGFSFARAISANGKPQTAIRELVLRDTGPSTFPGLGGVTTYDVDYARFDGVDIRSDTQHDEFTNVFSQYTLSGSHELTDRLTFNALVGYSNSDYDQPITTTIMFQRPNAGMTVDFRQNRDQPIITHNFNVADPTQYNFAPPVAPLTAGDAEIRLNQTFIENTYQTAEANLVFAQSDNLKIKTGLHLDQFEFDTSAKTRNGNTYNVPTLTGAAFTSLTRNITGFGDGLDAGVFPTSWTTIDYDKFIAAQDIYSNTGIYALVNTNGGIRNVQERVSAGYIQGEFNSDSWIVPFRGDVGVRFARTDIESTGIQSTGTPAPITVKHHYSDALPSANVVFDLKEDLLLRLSAAKVVSRPELGSLTPGGSITLSGTPSISSGNPFLVPIRANTFDAALEWYFAPQSLLSVAAFYKDIGSYIQNLSYTTSFRATGLPLNLLGNSGLDADNTTFTVNQPVNTPGGPLKGVEVSYQQAFSSLPGLLANTGAIFNYTHVESDITFLLPAAGASVTTQSDIVGLSRDAANATLYYEDGKLSARVSAAYRGPYTIALPANNPLQDREGVDKLVTIDMSASYQVTDHVKVTVEGLNILDEFNRQFIDSGRDSTFVYTHQGAQFNVGLQYKF